MAFPFVFIGPGQSLEHVIVPPRAAQFVATRRMT
jgi:hypothetical protein